MLNNKDTFFSHEFNKMLEMAIQKYKMTAEEEKAYKITLCWHDSLRKLFPDMASGRKQKGDPRKSLVFKYCFKLQRETKDKLSEDEYHLYVFAQLDILKRINIDNNEKPLININCLAGEKAWKRWKLWKYRYDALVKQKKSGIKNVNAPISISTEKVILGLKNTYEFLNKKLGKDYGFKEYKEKISNNDFKMWIILQKISPYYLILSNYFEKCKDLIDLNKINIDLNIYKVSISDKTKKIYEVLFYNELK